MAKYRNFQGSPICVDRSFAVCFVSASLISTIEPVHIAAKVIAGTLTGFAIRKALIKSVDAFSVLPGTLGKNGKPIKRTRLNTFFSPVTKALPDSDEYQNYKNGLGNVLALIVMTFTNFAIDMPLTRFLTNKFAEKGGLNNETSSQTCFRILYGY